MVRRLGASSHVCNDMKYMGKSNPSEEKVTIGDSSTVKAEAHGMAHLKTTEGQMVDLDDTLYIPEFDQNIISLGRFALKGHRIEMCDAVIKVWSRYDKHYLRFEREGNLYYLTASPRRLSGDEEETAMSMSTLQKGNKVDINDAHTVLGHIGKALLEKTAKEIGWELIGTLRTCDACAKAKAVATRVPKTASEKATKPGQRLLWTQADPTLLH